MKITTLALTLIAGTIVPCSAVLPLIDDFNDGNDAGWDHFEPLAGFGAAGIYSFPSGGYRIQASASPDSGLFGPGRAAGLRNDEPITATIISWDVVDWNDSLQQVFGGLARVRDTGLGTTDAYGLVYGNGSLDILRFDDEAVGALVAPSVAVTLNPANDYRFVFTLNGDALSGQVFDLAAPGVSVAALAGFDATYADGVTGLLVAAAGPGTDPADATFDNYNVSPIPEPTSGLLALLGCLAFLRRRR